MTEAEWLAATDPGPMLEFFRERWGASDRRLRLFACACGRWLWAPLTDGDRRAVEAGEWFADGLISAKEGDAARYAQSQAVPGRLPDPCRAAGTATFASSWAAAGMTAAHAAEAGVDGPILAALIREIIGNPFRPAPSLTPAVLSWNCGTVPKLAAAIYEERAFDRLPVLADALEDAGCADAQILAHCCSRGEQARACWVADLVLGKE
jgi:hypothetical protein